jgi:ribonuclease HI
MAKKKPKFYVVWAGHKPGVFTSWDDCKKQIDGFNQAKYKSFPSREEAEKAFHSPWQEFIGKEAKRKEEKDWIDLVGLPNKGSLTVDAACSGNPGKMEYRGVDLDRGKEVFRVGPLEEGTNNVGEFLALVHALAAIEKKQINYKEIYTDSKIAMGWIVQRKCKTKLKRTEANKKLWNMILRAENWLNTHRYRTKIHKWETKYWGEIPADFGRKK